jgi:hypothetical protein
VKDRQPTTLPAVLMLWTTVVVANITHEYSCFWREPEQDDRRREPYHRELGEPRPPPPRWCSAMPCCKGDSGPDILLAKDWSSILSVYDNPTLGLTRARP